MEQEGLETTGTRGRKPVPERALNAVMPPVRGGGTGRNVIARDAAPAGRFGAHVGIERCHPAPDGTMPHDVAIPGVPGKQAGKDAGIARARPATGFGDLIAGFGLQDGEPRAGTESVTIGSAAGQPVAESGPAGAGTLIMGARHHGHERGPVFGGNSQAAVS